MAIKRVTIELDDTPDTGNRTLPPPSLIGPEKALPADREKTDTPAQQEVYKKEEAEMRAQDTGVKVETIGRTPADLVVAFINRPEFMAFVLTFLAFLIFVVKLQQLSDFWFPLVTAGIFNAIWFGVRMLIRIFTKKST